MVNINLNPEYINLVYIYTHYAWNGDFMDVASLDSYLVIMHRAFRELVRGPDAVLAEYGLGRSHHRALFVIRRRAKLSVGELAQLLGITNQALHKTLKALIAQNLIISEMNAQDARRRCICLSQAGRNLENRISTMQRETFLRVEQQVGATNMKNWDMVMRVIEQEALKTLP